MDRFERRERRRGVRGALWGLGLIVLGVLFLLERQGVLPFRVWSVWWPLLVTGMGLIHMIAPRGAKDVGEGVTWILMSAWFFVAANDWHGLTWSRSWPLALVAAGAGTVARVIAEQFMSHDDGHVIVVGPEDRHDA